MKKAIVLFLMFIWDFKMIFSVVQKQYEEETKKEATYKIEGSTFHTLEYVKWIEEKLECCGKFAENNYCESCDDVVRGLW